MIATPEYPSIGIQALWTGRILTGGVALFLAFDGVIKVLNLPPVVQAFVQLGLPVELAPAIGAVQLVCLALYLLPRTSMLGAILLTGFLGGATAMKARMEDPWLLFSVAFGVLVWAGLLLRDPALRNLLPWRRTRAGN